MTAIHHSLQPGTALPARAATTRSANPDSQHVSAGLGFGDLVDLVNPLQHIPVVGHLYRHFSGDSIQPVIKIAGGALFGGPLGAAISVATEVFNSTQQEPEIPLGGVDPATVANTYPFQEQATAPVAMENVELANQRRMHVNRDIFPDSSNNPASHVTFTSTEQKVAGRNLELQHPTPGLATLVKTYAPEIQTGVAISRNAG